MNSLMKCQQLLKINIPKNARTISTSLTNFKDDFIHLDSHEPGIPPFVENLNEDVDTKKARLLYQSRKRGMLENGLLLSTFAQKYLNSFNEGQLRMYDRLINLPSNDWDIYNWATGNKETPSEFDNEIMHLFKKHVRNEERQTRYKQPDLY